MNKFKKLLKLIPVFTLILSILIGCSLKNIGSSMGSKGFDYSNNFTDEGFWKDIRALDYVDLCEYNDISIPGNVYEVTDDSVQAEIETILNRYSTEEKIRNRPVDFGDLVNIDYTGKVDGLELEGAKASAKGIDVVVGGTSLFGGFVDQLAGYSPGDSISVNVELPSDSVDDESVSKEAVFEVKINYIINLIPPELTDEFVEKNLYSLYGWKTIAQMEAGIKRNLKTTAVSDYLQKYILKNSTIISLPEDILKFQESLLTNYYKEDADYLKMDLNTYLETYLNISSSEELLRRTLAENTEIAKVYLVIQAIAEDAGITVTDKDVSAYFERNTGNEDYSEYKKAFGMPYLKFLVLNQKVLDYIAE